MKNKILIIVCVLLIVITTGCGNESKNTKEITFQSKVIENHNTYDYKKYSSIAEISQEFELALLDDHIDIQSISFELAKYVDGEYKTAIFTIDNDVDITLKFNDEQELKLVNIQNLNDENENYEDVKDALIKWNYWGFSFDEKEKLYSLENDTIEINDLEVEESSFGFTISYN